MLRVRKEFKTGKKKLEREAPPPPALDNCRGAWDGAREQGGGPAPGPAHTGFFSPKSPDGAPATGTPQCSLAANHSHAPSPCPLPLGAVSRSPGTLGAGCSHRASAPGATGTTSFSSCRFRAFPALHRPGRKCQSLWRSSPSRQPGTAPCFRSQSSTQPCPLL